MVEVIVGEYEEGGGDKLLIKRVALGVLGDATDGGLGVTEVVTSTVCWRRETGASVLLRAVGGGLTNGSGGGEGGGCLEALVLGCLVIAADFSEVSVIPLT